MSKWPNWIKWVLVTIPLVIGLGGWILLVYYMRKTKTILVLEPEVKLIKVENKSIVRSDGTEVKDEEIANTLTITDAVLKRFYLIRKSKENK